MIKKIVLTTLTLFTALGFSMNASAIDQKTTSGAACQAYFGSQETLISKYSNGAYNTQATAIWVSCGLVRDNVTNINGLNNAWVYINQPAASTSTCYMSSNASNGNRLQLSPPSTLTGPGWFWVPVTTSGVYGTYTAFCSLAPYSYLSTVLTREYPDTNL